MEEKIVVHSDQIRNIGIPLRSNESSYIGMLLYVSLAMLLEGYIILNCVEFKLCGVFLLFLWLVRGESWHRRIYTKVVRKLKQIKYVVIYLDNRVAVINKKYDVLEYVESEYVDRIEIQSASKRGCRDYSTVVVFGEEGEIIIAYDVLGIKEYEGQVMYAKEEDTDKAGVA